MLPLTSREKTRQSGKLEVVKFLIENGEDAGLKEEGTERTALDMARDFKRAEVVEFLEKYGALDK